MADKKNSEKIEREYIIPLRKNFQHVPRYKRTPKAIKTIKEFLVRHMQIRDRDLNKIKISKYLNELMWMDGIKNPPHKIKVRAIKEGDIVTVEAVELPEVLNFKKKREEKISKKAEKEAGKKKAEKKEENTDEKNKIIEDDKEKAKEEKISKKAEKEAGKKKAEKKEENTDEKNKIIEDDKEKAKEEEKKKFEEKKESTIEGMEKFEEQKHKQSKHLIGGKSKEQKHQFRQALEK